MRLPCGGAPSAPSPGIGCRASAGDAKGKSSRGLRRIKSWARSKSSINHGLTRIRLRSERQLRIVRIVHACQRAEGVRPRSAAGLRSEADQQADHRFLLLVDVLLEFDTGSKLGDSA